MLTGNDKLAENEDSARRRMEQDAGSEGMKERNEGVNCTLVKIWRPSPGR